MASVVINYSSNEQIFLDAIILETLKFSEDIVISYGSHLYDGTPENIDHINEYKYKYPTVQFVEYRVDISMNLMKQKGVVNRPTAYWHNLARYTGVNALKNKSWVFIIDCDEIPDGNAVKTWLEFALPILKETECYKIATYWYFKDPTNQSTILEDSILLIHYKHLTEENIFGDWERDYLIPASKCVLLRQVLGLDRQPMFHHYSWCRTREGLKHKLKNWGHSNEYENIDGMLEFIYHDDEVNDIIHNYKYNKVPNKFNIRLN